MELKLSSHAFSHGSSIPSRYTCDGDDINPELVIRGVRPEGKSLGVVMEDPDAPAGLWIHWLLWNIPPETAEIREHTVPFGAVEGLNSWGRTGYGGPCPPSGTHRYFFRLYVLGKKLDLAPGSTKGELERAMAGTILATAELMGTYMRTLEGPL